MIPEMPLLPTVAVTLLSVMLRQTGMKAEPTACVDAPNGVMLVGVPTSL